MRNGFGPHTPVLLLASLLLACGGDDGDPPPTDPNEPNDTLGEATPLTLGTPMLAAISSTSDLDHYAFTVPGGGANVRFQTFDAGGVECAPSQGNVDPYVEILDGDGVFVDFDDDTFPPFCEDVTVALGEGTNYVVVGGFPPVPFAYTLRVTIP
jgi:hypothetical protein